MNNPFAQGDPVPSFHLEWDAYYQYCSDTVSAFIHEVDTGAQNDTVIQLLTFIHQHGYPYVTGTLDLWANILTRCSVWARIPTLARSVSDVMAVLLVM